MSGPKSVQSPKIQILEVVLTVNSGSDSPCLQSHISVFAIFDHKVENIAKLAGIIRVAYDLYGHTFSRLQKGMFDCRVEDGDFLPGKAVKFSFNFRVVDNDNF